MDQGRNTSMGLIRWRLSPTNNIFDFIILSSIIAFNYVDYIAA